MVELVRKVFLNVILGSRLKKSFFQDGGGGHLGLVEVKMTPEDLFNARNGFLVIELVRKVYLNVIL